MRYASRHVAIIFATGTACLAALRFAAPASVQGDAMPSGAFHDAGMLVDFTSVRAPNVKFVVIVRRCPHVAAWPSQQGGTRHRAGGVLIHSVHVRGPATIYSYLRFRCSQLVSSLRQADPDTHRTQWRILRIPTLRLETPVPPPLIPCNARPYVRTDLSCSRLGPARLLKCLPQKLASMVMLKFT